jgi:glycosyltransferase involved in cell wall biosynthesis
VIPFTTKKKIDFNAIRTIRDAVRDIRPQVIHSFASRPLANSVLATIGLGRGPRLVSFRGITSPASRWDLANRISYLHPRVLGHACASDAVKQGLISSGIAAEKCFTTYDCVRVGELERPGRAALHSWDIPSEAFVVGTMACIRPVKGIDVLLEAARMCSDLKDIYWVLVGQMDDPRVAELAQDVAIRDRVRILGYRPDARVLASGFDLFVMPSRSEGLCLALLEAMAQGVCPVVSDAGGMKEVVRNGQDGLVVPRENATVLAGAIRALHGDRKRLAEYADSSEQRIADNFSVDHMGERTLELYRRVAA